MRPTPVLSAEAINITLKSISFDIPLSDLEALADTGTAPPSLGFIEAALTPQQLESLRSLLQQKADLDTTIVSQFFALPEGDIILGRLGSLIANGAPTNRQSENPETVMDGAAMLRQAVLGAAVDSEGLSLINIVRQFPAERLSLDVAQVIALVDENADFYGRRPEILQALRAAADENRSEIPLREIPDLSQAGGHAWRQQPLMFRNPNRSSFSFGDLYLPQTSKNSARPPVVQLTLGNPQAIDAIPLVVISHGLGSNRRSMSYLAEHLASHGYAALSIEHSATSSDRIIRFFNGMAAPPSPNELLLRPQDITAALDALATRAQSPNNPHLARINLDQVGVIGQSLGGYTALAAAGAQINRPLLAQRCPEEANRFTLNISLPLQCRILDLSPQASLQVQDPRVAAVLAINPLTSQIFGQQGLAQLDVPIMFVAGTHDYFAPALPEQLQPFTWLKTTHKYLLLANNSTHFSFLNDAGTSELLPTSQRLLGPDGSLARPTLQALGLAFFNRHLQGDRGHSFYLNQTYVERLAKFPFDYSLVETVPPTLLSTTGSDSSQPPQ